MWGDQETSQNTWKGQSIITCQRNCIVYPVGQRGILKKFQQNVPNNIGKATQIKLSIEGLDLCDMGANTDT